jgi:hypothetical protein
MLCGELDLRTRFVRRVAAANSPFLNYLNGWTAVGLVEADEAPARQQPASDDSKDAHCSHSKQGPYSATQRRSDEMQCPDQTEPFASSSVQRQIAPGQ